jgi:transposase
MIMARTRKTLTLDEKIERAQENMFRAKDKYQAAQDEVKRLLEKKKEMNRKEILDAYEKTSRSHEEILRFMLGEEKES